jgi:hypothetical protein
MKTNVILIMAVLLITSAGCSKYEEGSFFTVLTKKARITNTWEPVKYVYPNGSSSTDVDEGQIKLDKDMNVSWDIDFDGTTFSVPGKWRFIDDKLGINITVSAFNYQESRDFEILKLTNKELWVRDQNDLVTHFEAQ